MNNCDSSSRASHRHPGRGSVPLGTRRLELALQSTAGVGPQEGLAKFGQFRRGMAKGAKTPWLRSLLTFCRIAESKSLRGSSGGEERVIFSPRGSGPDGGLGGFVPGPSGPLSLFLEATQRKTERTAVAILRFEPGGAEVQEADIGAGHRRRPTVPAVADVIQLARTVFCGSIPAVAEARGRARCSRKTQPSRAERHPRAGGGSTSTKKSVQTARKSVIFVRRDEVSDRA